MKRMKLVILTMNIDSSHRGEYIACGSPGASGPGVLESGCLRTHEFIFLV